MAGVDILVCAAGFYVLCRSVTKRRCATNEFGWVLGWLMKIEDVYFKSKIIYCNYNLYITLMLWCFGAISGVWTGVGAA